MNHLNQSNCSALFYACKQGHLDVVKLLLLKGAKTEASFSSSSLRACCPFMTAVRHRHTTVALLLIRHDADWSSLLHVPNNSINFKDTG